MFLFLNMGLKKGFIVLKTNLNSMYIKYFVNKNINISDKSAYQSVHFFNPYRTRSIHLLGLKGVFLSLGFLNFPYRPLSLICICREGRRKKDGSFERVELTS